MLEQNFARIKSEIGNACLVAITKDRGIMEINRAISAGISNIGENRVQEAMEKLPALSNRGLVFHMVGHLQSNKVKSAVGLFDIIQSVDSIPLAKKIATEAARQKKRITIYLQANVSGNKRQGGFSAGEFESAAKEIRKSNSDYFEVGGLMAIASIENPRRDFQEARKLFENSGLRVYSAGMSSDYQIALEEGSNMVRLGTAIFGDRKSERGE